jgi:hypothetical protein
MKNYIFHSNCFDDNICNNFISYFENVDHSKYLKRGENNYLGISTSLSKHEDFANILYSKIDEYLEVYPYLKTEYSTWGVCEHFNIQKYLPGECYDTEHMEHGNQEPFSLRLLAWMVYLNTIHDKGGTRWPQQNFETNPVKGDLYIWPAGWTHSHHGVPTSEIKYIITGWCAFEKPQYTVPIVSG